jgi:hypothetical protein
MMMRFGSVNGPAVIGVNRCGYEVIGKRMRREGLA